MHTSIREYMHVCIHAYMQTNVHNVPLQPSKRPDEDQKKTEIAWAAASTAKFEQTDGNYSGVGLNLMHIT